MLRPAVFALLPFVLVAVARKVEAALGLVLHTGLPDPQLLSSAIGVVAADPRGLAAAVGVWTAAGAVAWGGLAWWRSASDGLAFRVAAARDASTFTPLWLLPATTLLGVLALAARATWPYGHTLAVALTQDLSLGREALVAAALVVRRMPAFRIPAPRGGAVFFVTFLAYALLTPDGARQWDNHPGNEPKYLRMAVALGHRLSLDVEPVSASLEELAPLPLTTAIAGATRGLLRESWAMQGALWEGPRGVGREAIRATRITRQTIGGKDGGVYHVLAPGPSLLLAPVLRIDRALNLRFQTPGRLAVSVLLMNALGALLVLAVFQLTRDATGRAGLAAVVAFAFAFLPPFLFYFFQFYPEMPGALVLAVLFRLLFLNERLRGAPAWGAGLLLATLPWLHQKFLPVWLVLAGTAAVAEWRRGSSASGEASSRRLVLTALLLPQAVSLYLTALYNFGITGSVRPDALFLAWGPAGVTTARVGQGLLGLWLDARYGLLPVVPVYALGFAGLFLKTEGGARLLRAVPAALVYYLTVAAADNWAGAVCNLGRYLMPILPLVVAFAAIAVDRTIARRGVLAVVLTLLLVSGLFAWALWLDPHAANDSAVLFAQSRFADASVYVPGLFIRTWAAGAPGLFARIAAWVLLVAGLVAWLRRITASRGEKPTTHPAREGDLGAEPGARPLRAVVMLLGLVVATAALLERWPSRRPGPVLGPSVTLADGRTVILDGPVRWKDDVLELAPGPTTLVVRSAGRPGSLAVLAGGSGLLERPGGGPLALRPAGVLLSFPLEEAAVVTGKDGARETLSTLDLRVTGAPMALRFPEQVGLGPSAAPETLEPSPSGER